MNPKIEQFFEDLEALVDSGGGMIKIGNKRMDINAEDAEAALVYLSMLETDDIEKAMRDISYFKDVIEMGREEMGYEHNTKKESNENPKTYTRILGRMKQIVR